MNTTEIIIYILISFVLGVIAGYHFCKVVRYNRERKHLK